MLKHQCVGAHGWLPPFSYSHRRWRPREQSSRANSKAIYSRERLLVPTAWKIATGFLRAREKRKEEKGSIWTLEGGKWKEGRMSGTVKKERKKEKVTERDKKATEDGWFSLYTRLDSPSLIHLPRFKRLPWKAWKPWKAAVLARALSWTTPAEETRNKALEAFTSPSAEF